MGYRPGRSTPTHNLRPNHDEWTPPCLIFADTETATTDRGERHIHTLRLWSARLIQRRTAWSKPPCDVWADGTTADQLADQIEQWTVGRETVWFVCHNLGFDLVTTRLPLILSRRGWQITAAALTKRSPFIRLSRGRKRIVMVDSTSWLPSALEAIGIKIGISKPPLPSPDDDQTAWSHRCRQDVRILSEAMIQLLDWWDRNRAGHFSITGPQCGWNFYRHTPATFRPVIVTDPEQIKFDRRAIYGGRRQIWRAGDLTDGPYIDFDFHAAYCQIAATEYLPQKRMLHFDSLPLDHQWLDRPTLGIIAEVVIRTDRARFPVRLHNRNWYPTGRFHTVLAGPEIAAARELGCLESIGPGYLHRLTHHMAPWAEHCLALTDGVAADAPPAVQIAAKAWGRSVIGKWAAHSSQRYKLGPAPTLGWGWQDGRDRVSGGSGGILDLAGTRYWVDSGMDSDNAYPAVLAYVESAVRVRLSDMIDALGDDTMIQCDTDGIIIDPKPLTRPGPSLRLTPGPARAYRLATDELQDGLSGLTTPLVGRVKNRYEQLTVIGPQHYVSEGMARLSGIPGNAVRTGKAEWSYTIWPGLDWQASHGDPAGFVTRDQTARLTTEHVTGWRLTDGRIIPPTMTISDDGRNRIVGWKDTIGREDDHILDGRQRVELDRAGRLLR